jgi:predicted transcriptional regulator
MELPFHLRALPEEALDVLRFFGSRGAAVAYAGEIMDGCGLSDRGFGKVIRRLVTKGYLHMDGDQAYRLSDNGSRAVGELGEYDTANPAQPRSAGSSSLVNAGGAPVQRRMLLVAPGRLVSGQPTAIAFGFQSAEPGEELDAPVDVLVRVSVLNGQPIRPKDESFTLVNRAEHKPLTITAGAFDALRLKVEAFQLDAHSTDISVAGGMYVDLPVVAAVDGTPAPVAYGTDVTLSRA